MIKILYADDIFPDSGVRYLPLEKLFIRQGFEVIRAESGQQAIKLARSKQPDLILMDLAMPVMDGWKAAKEIKAFEDTKHIPIIALSAHAMPKYREKISEAGFDDYDTKPIELPRLLNKIHCLLPTS